MAGYPPCLSGWIERGIGETRFALVENGEIIEARIMLDGTPGRDASRAARARSIGRNAVAAPNGTEFLLPKGAAGH